MINQDDIYRKIKKYLPAAEDDLVNNLIPQVEKQMELSVEEIIRKLVLQKVGTRIDTKA
jgi:hypothetical protein